MTFIDRKVCLGFHVAQMGLIEGCLWSKVALIKKNHVFYRSKGGCEGGGAGQIDPEMATIEGWA